MLIDSNILGSKKMMLDFVIEFFTIDSCRNMIAFMKVISFRKKIYKAIRAYNATLVSSYLNIMMSIRLRDKCKVELSKNRNLIFMSTKLFDRFELSEGILNYIIDVNMCAI